MKTLMSCAYNMDNCCVELKFTDECSVLYLWQPLTLERGCHHAGQPHFGGSRTGRFCGLKGTQNEKIQHEPASSCRRQSRSALPMK